MRNFTVTKYKDNPEWDRIDIKLRFEEWSIDSTSGGDIEIMCSDIHGNHSLFLNQDELKQLIEFLQSKVK